MIKPSPARYRTTNWSSYTAALCKRGSLLIWLDKDMIWLAPPDGSPGRPAVFFDAAIQFCLTIKVLFKLPLRQTTGMVASLPKMANLDWAVPDYTTLCRRQKTLAVQIPYLSRENRWPCKIDRKEQRRTLWFAKPFLEQVMPPSINLLPPEIVTLCNLRHRSAVTTHFAHHGKLLGIRPATPTLNRTQNITSHAALT